MATPRCRLRAAARHTFHAASVDPAADISCWLMSACFCFDFRHFAAAPFCRHFCRQLLMLRLLPAPLSLADEKDAASAADFAFRRQFSSPPLRQRAATFSPCRR